MKGLYPCPKCGARSQAVYVDAHVLSSVECMRCGTRIETEPGEVPMKEEIVREYLVDAWNRRYVADALDQAKETYDEGLKPCPFCGGHPRLDVSKDTGNLYFVVLCGCGGFFASYAGFEDAVRGWNGRADRWT